ncbi:hypothetical protein [Zunongwangia sp. HGR-M22]|uniref:hypothetical protein n=1 Tax=Zunongwangia sp. HGR-M22 TaxID=3015168 RepID=UPI0022DDE4C5|nr:hypothetical protein [Zunongwangia sp. HGR-M22]WBL26768.1 hypothetical protein PBT91_05770 [Zunongwangia sp. HGR-M22]
MKVLTLYQYKLLSDHEQYELLFTQGDFLDMVIEGNSRFAVYALFRFFVEVEYNNKENNGIAVVLQDGIIQRNNL